ncbi:MAG: hypothetical protein QOG06_95 [Gaiellaceae bacterium]|jgi:hypothetical protein|nr:hypothetical protein [Gaiellaceae bacterium]MDX6505451.1 hypothetical protein [Gaiellaceae bacterium]
MAYDEELAARIRDLVAGEDGLTEKTMFGGLAFLVNGNMAVAASGQARRDDAGDRDGDAGSLDGGLAAAGVS